MTGPGAAHDDRRGYLVFRQVAPDVWFLISDVDYRPGLTARAERARAVLDATGEPAAPGELHAALQRDQWHVLRHG